MKVSKGRLELAQIGQRKYWEQGWKGDIDRQQRAKNHWSRLVSILKEQISLKPNDKILDIGCGPCGMINCFDIGERYGLDPLIDYYLSNFDMPRETKWVRGIGESLPFKDEHFDVVIATDTLDHVEEPGKVLAEIKRVLKEGGFLFLTINIYTQCIKLIKSTHKTLGIGSPAELHTFTAKRIEQLLHRLGFRITSSRYDVVDLEVVTRASASKVVGYKQYFRKALEVRREYGLKEGLKFTLSFLTGGRSYQGDLILIAVKQLK